MYYMKTSGEVRHGGVKDLFNKLCAFALFF